MKILCVSDQIDPLVYSLSMKERFKDVDFVLSAGDLPPEYLSFIVSFLNKPLFFVEGNHESASRRSSAFYSASPDFRPCPEAPEECTGAVDVGKAVYEEEGVIVAGLPGCMRYNRGPSQYTDFQMWLMVLSLVPRLLLNRLTKGRFVDIVLTHAPPFGIHDKADLCHRGFKSFLWLMRVFKPRFLVHGHVHLYDLNDVRVSRVGGTSIVNAFGHCVVAMDEAKHG
jgi:uncharacterized protein